MPKDVQDERFKKYKEAEAGVYGPLGLDEYGESISAAKIEKDSASYPDHMFKIGYLRSSYNDGGINSFFRKIGIPDLYDIFKPNDRYEFAPGWNAALGRCDAAIKAYGEYLASSIGDISIMKVSHNPFCKFEDYPDSEEAAFKIIKKQIESRSKSKDDPLWSGAYGSIDGDFWLKESLEVVGLIPGREKKLLGEGYQPCFYVAYRREKENVDWYMKALLITKEMIEYVLAQPDKKDYYLHWSA